MSKKIEIRILKIYLHPHVHCCIIHNRQDMETTQMSINRYTDKENVAYAYNGILFSLKKEENPVTMLQHG